MGGSIRGSSAETIFTDNGLLGPSTRGQPTLTTVNIEPVIAALGTRFDAEESVVIERILREYNGTIPDKQLVSEVGLALAIHRRGKRRRG